MDKALQKQINTLLPTLLNFLKASQSTMLSQLEDFCHINSFSENLQGLQLMNQALTRVFSPLADSISNEILPQVKTYNLKGDAVFQTCGNALFIQKRPQLKNRVLLCGHMDTVYPKDHPFQMLTTLDNHRINGPGVADMKGGLIVMLHALIAFEEFTNTPTLGWDVLINSDEEIGSIASSSLLNRLAPKYKAALLYEPAMNIQGSLARNRKGNGKFTLIAKGLSAHAGRSFDQGRNAICYLAKAISMIHELNGQREGVTINIGKMAGGTALNMVPDTAVAMLDVRLNDPLDETFVLDELHAIVHELQHPDYTMTIHGSFGRPVKIVNEGTQALFAKTKSLAELLHCPLDWQDSGGCCDGNNLAAFGLPVLDTLGVIGGDLHTPNEFIIIDSLVQRAALSTLLLMNMEHDWMDSA